MADPITLIGTIAAAANIIDVLNSTISSLHGLRSQWRNAELSFMNLMAQLRALRSALGEIHEWLLSENMEPHHQLIMDLDFSLACCKTLCEKIWAHLSKLTFKQDSRLDNMSRVKIVIGSKSMEEIQKMLGRQTGLLTLLLTACNCTTTSKQCNLLGKTSVRKRIKRVQDDSSSLMSKLSLVFQFDKVLLSTKVYQRLLRGSLKDSIRLQQADTKRKKYEDADQSSHIEVGFGFNLKRRRREVKIFFLGGCRTKEAVLAAILDLAKPISEAGRKIWRRRVVTLVVSSISEILDAGKKANIAFEHIDKDKLSALQQEAAANMDFELDDGFVNIVKRFWENSQVQELVQNWAKTLDESAPSIDALQSLHDSMNPQYQPRHLDLLNIRHRSRQIEEHRIQLGQIDCTIVESVGSNRWDDPAWSPDLSCFFEQIPAVAVTVDLACYSRCPRHSPLANEMKETFAGFERLLRHPFLTRAAVIVILTNPEGFSSRLAEFPLSRYFPDFEESNGSNAAMAIEYIRNRFISLYLQHGPELRIRVYVSESNDLTILDRLYTVIQDVVIKRALSRGIMGEELENRDEKLR